MSASLGAVMGGRPFVSPNSFGSGNLQAAPGPAPYVPSASPIPAPSQALTAGNKLRVVNIASNDALNMRELPDQQSKVIGIIPPDGRGIDFEGERRGAWVFVRYDRVEGWIPVQFVVADPLPVKRGRKLDDGE